MLRRSLPPALMGTLAVSAVGHCLVVLAVALAAKAAGRQTNKPEMVITTKLVRLGKERPTDYLPRKPVEPPAAVHPAPNLGPVNQSPPAAAKGKNVSERLSEMRRLSDALSRIRKQQDEQIEGHPDGTPEGEVTSLSQALIGNKYTTEIYKCVKANYSIEGVPPQRIAGRSALVSIRVKTDGTFFDFRMEKGSGLTALDHAVERAVKKCGRVSPPPAEILRRVHEDGIEFEFTP